MKISPERIPVHLGSRRVTPRVVAVGERDVRSSQIDARFGSPRGGPAGARISRFGSPPDFVGLPIIRMINLGGVRSPEGVGAISGRFRGLVRRVVRGIVRRVLRASDGTRQRRHDEEIGLGSPVPVHPFGSSEIRFIRRPVSVREGPGMAQIFFNTLRLSSLDCRGNL